MPLVIAACSNRKRSTPIIRAMDLAADTVERLGKQWLSRLDQQPVRPASELYCGRSIRSAERAAGVLQADLMFASAGLGWVRSTQDIPSYSMTIVAGEDNVLTRLTEAIDAATWWRWLNRYSPFSTSLASAVASSSGIILIALPKAYLAMIERDLLQLSDSQLERLRIIQRDGAVLPALKPWTITYDDRLEGTGDHSGTRSDFTARAACHFVEKVLPEMKFSGAVAHEKAVQESLANWTAVPIRVGARRSDIELRNIIAQHWDAAEGRTTRLLRMLRDDLGIACEQGRFGRLINAMRAEREAAQ